MSESKRVHLEIGAVEFENDPLRFRQALGVSKMRDGTEIEVTLCMSGQHIYFRNEGRQMAIAISSLITAVANHWEGV